MGSAVAAPSAFLARRIEVLPSGERVTITPADGIGTPMLVENDTLVNRVDGRDIRIPIKYYYICRDEEVQHFVDWREAQLAQKHNRLGWDTETSGIHWYNEEVATVQFGSPEGDARSYTIDVRCLSPAMLQLALAPIEDLRFLKFGQNLKFECLYTMHGIVPWATSKEAAKLGSRMTWRPKRLIDTQVTELIIRAGLSESGNESGGGEPSRKAYGNTSMAKLVKRYCGGIDIDKDHDLRVSFYTTPAGTHSARQIVYAGGDTIHPFTIFAGQRPEIEARALRSTLSIEYELIAILAEMEIRGMAFDKAGWIALWQESVERQDNACYELDKIFLSVEGDLFAGTDQKKIPAKDCPTCEGSGKRPAGRWTKVECADCGGTGRTGSGLARPIYLAGTSRTAKPKPLNWAAPQQVKWAVQQYCRRIDWKHEVLVNENQVRNAKMKNGGLQWILEHKDRVRRDCDLTITYEANEIDMDTLETKSLGRGLLVGGVPTREVPDEAVDCIPEWILSEDTYCILTTGDYKTLMHRKIRGQLPADFAQLLIDYAETKARIGTFGKDFLKNVHADGRVRFEFHQAITSTGRLSAAPNSMNIPRDKRYRDCFRAARGKRLCIADYSQQEPRTSAAVSGDEVYTKNYLAGGDLYLTILEEMLGYKPDLHSEDKELAARSKRDRQVIKIVVLALAYRMGPGKLRDELTRALGEPVTLEFTRELHANFLEKCSGIKAFQELCYSLANPKGEGVKRIWDIMLNEAVTWIESPCGRKRFFPPDALNTYTEACNAPIQGCGATMTKAAMVLTQREIEKRGWAGRAYFVNAIHDELVSEADTEIAPEVAQVMKECMEKAGAYYISAVPIVASFPTPDGTADRWLKE